MWNSLIALGIKFLPWFSRLCIISRLWPPPLPPTSSSAKPPLTYSSGLTGFYFWFLGLSVFSPSGNWHVFTLFGMHFLPLFEWWFFFSHLLGLSRCHLFSEVPSDPTPCPHITIYPRTMLISFTMLSTRQQITGGQRRCLSYSLLSPSVLHAAWHLPNIWVLNEMDSHFVLILQLLQPSWNLSVCFFLFFRTSAVSHLFSLLLSKYLLPVGFCALSWTLILQFWIHGCSSDQFM